MKHCLMALGAALSILLLSHAWSPPAAQAFGEVEYNGVKYFCVVGEPWTLVNVCVYIETDYTNSSSGLDLSNQGDVFPFPFGTGPDLIHSFLANPSSQGTTIGWSLPNLNPLVPGSAGVLNGNAQVQCATGNIVHLAITWDGDIHADLGPVTEPSISPLINAGNTSSRLISQPALVVEIPTWDRGLFPNLSALRGHQHVRICGRWVVDTNGDEQWAEFHPATSVTILEPPTIDAHSNVDPVEATGAAGAVVSYVPPATHDVVDGTGTATCAPASGATFALGTTIVTCRATDAAGNVATPTSFTVTVQDTTPPRVTVPADMAVEATSAAGAVVTFTASATDLVDGSVGVTCSPASGSTFPIAATTTVVTCSATDGHGNRGSKSFNVTVQDTTPPTVTVPADLTVEATSAAGAVVTFTVSATDLVDGSVAVSCTPAAGSTFGISPTIAKTTPVTCTATDAHGNSGSKSFQVTVQDTTPPKVTVPADMTVDATSPQGAVVTFNTSATDLVDGTVAVSCTPSSGSTFGLTGTASKITTVTCSATDAHGNTGQSRFTVTVNGTGAQVTNLLAKLTPLAAALGIPANVVAFWGQQLQAVVAAGATPRTCAVYHALKAVPPVQPGPRLTVAQAAQLNQLLADLTRIGVVIGC